MISKLLALDIATKCGYCSEQGSGVWDFQKKRGDSYGIRLVKFRAAVKEIIEREGIEIVVYERPAGQFKSSIMVASEMIGVLMLLCEEKGIHYTAYSATEIKKFWTGKGNAKKQDMIDESKRRFPNMEILDDNHADAQALYHLAIKDLNL